MVWDTIVYFYIRDAVEEPHRWIEGLEKRRTRLDAIQEALLDVGLVMAGETPGDRDVIMLLEEACRVFERAGLPLEAAVARQHQAIRRWRAGDSVAALGTFQRASREFNTLDHDSGAWPGSRWPRVRCVRRSTDMRRRWRTSDPPCSARGASTTFPR